MLQHDLPPIADFDLETLMRLVELLAEHEIEGRLTLLRVPAGWKVALGTPDLETEEGRQAVLRLPAYGQLKDALVALLVRRKQVY